jgi:hypothetical protein
MSDMPPADYRWEYTGGNIAKFGKKGKTLLQEEVLIASKLGRPQDHFNTST